MSHHHAPPPCDVGAGLSAAVSAFVAVTTMPIAIVTVRPLALVPVATRV